MPGQSGSGRAPWREAARPWLLLALPAAFLALFLAYPLQGILRESLFGETASGGDLRVLWEDSYYLERLWFTTWQAALSTALTVAFAFPCAYALAHFQFPGKGLLVALVTVPFVLPTVVVAVAFSALLGPNGLANDWLERLPGVGETPIKAFNTLWIILLAHVFYNVALAARMIAAGWESLDPRLNEAAEVLGAGRTERFLRVTLPLLRAPVLAAASLVFLFCFSSFGVILILGGPKYSTVEVEIYREMVFLFRPSLAAALAIIQVAVTLGFLVVYAQLGRGDTASATTPPRERQHSRREVAAAAAILAVLVLFTVAPLGALVERSLHGSGGYTLEYYRALGENTRNQALFVTPLRAARNSLYFATLATLLALPLGVLTAYGVQRLKRGAALVEGVLLIPLGVSAVTLGLGFLITLDEPPLDLRDSRWLVVIAHALIGYPFVARATGAQLRSIDPRLREAARVLGEGPLGVFVRVDLPLIWRGVIVGGVFAFAISMGEFGATLLIARPEWPTLPLAIFRYLGQPGALNYGQALAMSTILMAVTATAFVLIERLRVRGIGAIT